MYTEPSRFATVVGLGEPRWIPGTFWHFRDGKRWLDGYYEHFGVRIGDTVLCNRYPKSARPIIWQGQEFVIVDENEILAKVEERRDAEWWNRLQATHNMSQLGYITPKGS